MSLYAYFILNKNKCLFSAAGADKKAEAGAGVATEFQFVSIVWNIQFKWDTVLKIYLSPSREDGRFSPPSVV